MSNLGQHLKFSNGKTSPDRTDTGFYPVYGANGIIGYSSEYNSDENTIIIGRVGSYCGSVHFSDKKCWVTDNAISARSMNLKESIFWFYYLKSLNLNSMRVGSGQPLLNQTILKSISLPDLNINKIKVGEILLGFDQKIDLNTQINQTLEQIAQALFKSWFVDFDPVCAKVQALSDGLSLEQAELAAMQAISGKIPEELTALSQTQPERYAELAETAKAFPCEMVEIDGVEVPKGWEYQYLKDICNIVYGKNLPTTKLIKEGYPVFGGNGVIGYYDKFLYETPQTLVSCRGAASGKVLYSLPYSFVTNNSLVIEHEKSGLSYFYIYEVLKLQNLTELTSGSAQPQMTIANMAAVQILVPSEKINEVCKKYLGTLYNQIYQNNIENETLAQTRDLLLPKLLNGEI
ncbi:Type I restriction modification DNA specificity domain protein [Haemophilus influenzae]|uniref:restriction endonuclease subunit S n=1 Tax=Haemophilus influenzae TaxID=727 RepID=UPI000D009BAC|nr:restriction endonuclease subunit S [Haemophilus influenzae]MCK9005411.1 restriction endonuclease subunit S [Haemophilus influenzae]PRI65876.1 Type I restriction modification DNA specificity domain protein [Haemophilus influenzae]